LFQVWNGVTAVNIKRRLQQATVAVLPVSINGAVDAQKGVEAGPAHGPIYYVPVRTHAAEQHQQAQYTAMTHVPTAV
jgi:hypothetical protein